MVLHRSAIAAAFAGSFRVSVGVVLETAVAQGGVVRLDDPQAAVAEIRDVEILEDHVAGERGEDPAVAFFFLTIQGEAFDLLVRPAELQDEVLGKGMHMRVRVRNRIGEAEGVVDRDPGFFRTRTDQADAAFEGDDFAFREMPLPDPDDVA